MGHQRQIVKSVEFEYQGDRYRADVWSTKRGDSKAERWTDEELINSRKKIIDKFKLHKIKIPFKI